MSGIEELRRRVEDLETPVHHVEKQQAGTRHLAETAETAAAATRDHRRSDVGLIRILLDAQESAAWSSVSFGRRPPIRRRWTRSTRARRLSRSAAARWNAASATSRAP
jgi:hypothetical protein